jgi:hypothetical protein
MTPVRDAAPRSAESRRLREGQAEKTANIAEMGQSTVDAPSPWLVSEPSPSCGMEVRISSVRIQFLLVGIICVTISLHYT